MTTAAMTTYAGWYRQRPGGRWCRLAEGDGLTTAWGKLLAVTRHLPPGELVVLESFRHPDRRDAKGVRR